MRRRLAVPPLRRVLLDFLQFAKQMPLVTAERRMQLGPLVAARSASRAKPSWTALFMKAFALVAERRPELRRIYCRFPWPHFYEHDVSVAFFAVERAVAGESTVLFGHRKHPEHKTLAELTHYLRSCQERPVEHMKLYRRMRRLAHLPGLLRRLPWRIAKLLGGATCVRNFGTFGMSSTAADGAGLATILSVTTSTLHYGLFDANGNLDFRLTFDHRVYDGALAARALVDMEKTLLNEVLTEVLGHSNDYPATEWQIEGERSRDTRSLPADDANAWLRAW